MSKIILIVIILAIIIVVILGLYLIFSGSTTNTTSTKNQNSSENNQNTNTFNIQGMKVEILKQGSGDGAKAQDMVTVHYTGTLESGVKFDSSLDRNSPFSFTLGQGRVIKGWDLGVEGMKVGEKRTLTIPSDLAYGENGFPPVIPKSATLIFQIEMLKIN